MHELSIALSILDGVEEKMASYSGTRLEAVLVRVGALSGVVPEALLSAYELASSETEFAGSHLLIEQAPVLIYCARCGTEQPVVSQQYMSCRICGTPSADVRSGMELEVFGLQVVDER
jgi:hydrogenase nickel incorporation protein HypA/HybF